MFAKLRAAVASHSLLGLHLITHKVHDRDRSWFDTCKLTHLHAAPGTAFELIRILLLLLCSGITAPWFHTLWLVHAGLIFLWYRRLTRMWLSGTDPARLVTAWSRFIVGRAILCAIINGVALVWVPSEYLVPLVIFILATDALVLFAHFSLPIAGLISSWISTLGMTAALMMRPEVPPMPALLLMLLLLGSAHTRIFNLHYMFATRRLRTRELRTANETIQLLLTQYREHGSDCLVEVDSAGFVLEPSEELSRLLGAHVKALAGAKLLDLFNSDSGLESVRAAARRLQPFHEVILSRMVQGKTRWFLISGCSLLDLEGHHYGFRGFLRDVTDRYEAENKVRFLAHHDPLTGLANRLEFRTRLSERLAGGGAEQLAVLFADLDHFKLVNDSLGHAAGDQVLEIAAKRLAKRAGPHDLVGRLGGDEFALLLGNAQSAEAALEYARHIVADLSRPIEVEGRTIQMGGSVGLALAPYHADNADDLLRAADMALYEAKSAGRGAALLYNRRMKEVMLERRALELELGLALTNGEFELHYQPIFELATDQIVGFEALLRWRHPLRGMIPPGNFIALAEQSGLVVQIGEWVLREAIAEAATWEGDMTVAVNVSAVQMLGDDFLRQVVSALATSNFDPRRLELEITETALMQDQEACLSLLHRLRSLGVRISLDDFGTGYSSLNYLRSFPFDKIKIDRCFIADLCQGGESGTIVESVLDLAARLNMQTIAEGVEDASQLDALRQRGCNQVQGYLISRALPATELPVTRVAALSEQMQRTGKVSVAG